MQKGLKELVTTTGNPLQPPNLKDSKARVSRTPKRPSCEAECWHRCRQIVTEELRILQNIKQPNINEHKEKTNVSYK